MTTIHVTNDRIDGMALSDRIAVMPDGVIVQVGTRKDAYEHPATLFGASFFGKAKPIGGVVESVHHGLGCV